MRDEPSIDFRVGVAQGAIVYECTRCFDVGKIEEQVNHVINNMIKSNDFKLEIFINISNDVALAMLVERCMAYGIGLTLWHRGDTWIKQEICS